MAGISTCGYISGIEDTYNLSQTYHIEDFFIMHNNVIIIINYMFPSTIRGLIGTSIANNSTSNSECY